MANHHPKAHAQLNIVVQSINYSHYTKTNVTLQNSLVAFRGAGHHMSIIVL